MNNELGYHLPVLLHRSVDELVAQPSGTYVDVTFGGGGHSKAILTKLAADGKLIGFDQDADASANTIDDSRFQFAQSNFRYLKNTLRFLGIKKIDGLLADLGVSSHQFDEVERGFSIRGSARLDMRMGTDAALDAYKVVNEYSEPELSRIFKSYGELRDAPRVANRIVYHRSQQPIETTDDLIEKISSLSPEHKRNSFLAKVFQAIRIEVNNELEVLEELLVQAAEVLKPGGRLVVIAYHSLEDRLVKRHLQSGNAEGKLDKDLFGNVTKPFTQKKGMPIVPDDEEIKLNSRPQRQAPGSREE